MVDHLFVVHLILKNTLFWICGIWYCHIYGVLVFFLVGEVYIANCMYFPGNHLQHGGRHAVHINIKL